jgi:ribosomal peptide maturation radical SAM protein 1
VEALDFVFSGPALRSFPELVRRLADGDEDGCHELTGVYSRRKLARLGLTPAGTPAEVGPDLDIDVEVPLDYDDFLASFDEKLGTATEPPQLVFETSRGCWWGERAHCTFCGLNKNTMGYRAMRPDLAVELIRSLFRWADRTSVVMCVDNILQRQYVKEVFPYLDTPPEVPIFYQLKANLNEQEVAAMARANVKLITPGFESLNSNTLKLMDKGVSAFHNLQVMKHCTLYDVHPGWNILVGSPGEPAETYEKYVHDLPLFVHLPPPQGLFSIHFNRYSPYFMYPEKWGLDLVPVDYYSLVYPFPPESIHNIAYDWTDQNLEADYLQALARWIDPVQEKIRAWRRKWGEDGSVAQPQLYLDQRGEETWIYDSRFDEVREYPVTPAVRQLLLSLNETRKVSSLAGALASVEGPDDLDVEHDLAFARERGLLFEEDGKALSLVLPRKPPQMTHRASALGVQRRLKPSAEPAIAAIPRAVRRVVKPARVGA